MPVTYQATKQLYYCRLRVFKDDAYFVYFTFESNEGLCFYSTVDDSLKGSFRDIDVKCPIEAQENLLALIERLKTELRLDILEEKITKPLGLKNTYYGKKINLNANECNSYKFLTNWIKEGRRKTITEITAEANTYIKVKGGNKP